jgi:glucose/mannose-6-phosphate isomerase
MGMSLATLDDPASIRTADPGGMLSLVASTGRQLRRGFELAAAAPGLSAVAHIDSVAVFGMGGSGVAGDILRSLFSEAVSVPIVVCKGYVPPAFCGPNTLAIAVSFSGETEETLAAYSAAAARGCRVACVSSGGRLAAMAAADRSPSISIPTDVAMPRAALGYLAGACIGVLDAAGLIPPAGASVEAAGRFADELVDKLAPDRPTQENEAKRIALSLLGRTPVVWGSEGLAEAAALRWKTQLNENAKIAAFHAVLSELDHNEVEGWSDDGGSGFVAVALRHAGEHRRIQARVDATRALVARSGLEVLEVRGSGSSPLERLLSLVLMGDFASVYLAILRGVDPTPVPALMGLKERLRG